MNSPSGALFTVVLLLVRHVLPLLPSSGRELSDAPSSGPGVRGSCHRGATSPAGRSGRPAISARPVATTARAGLPWLPAGAILSHPSLVHKLPGPAVQTGWLCTRRWSSALNYVCEAPAHSPANAPLS